MWALPAFYRVVSFPWHSTPAVGMIGVSLFFPMSPPPPPPSPTAAKYKHTECTGTETYDRSSALVGYYKKGVKNIPRKLFLLINMITRKGLYEGWISNDDGDGNGNGKKAIGFISAKQQLCSVSGFFVHFLAVVHDYNLKVPNFKFCRGREHKTTTTFFFSWTLIQSFRSQLRKNLPTFDELTEMVWTRSSFEAARIHFLSDVFPAVAAVFV